MKTRKILAFVLSVLMIISAVPATSFASPVAASVADTTQEQAHVHDESTEHKDIAESELYAAINESWKKNVHLTFDNGFYTLKDTYVICNTCKSYVYIQNDYNHSIYHKNISADFSTPGAAKITYTFAFSDCNGQMWYSDEKTATVEFNCEEEVFKLVFAKVNGQYAYTAIRRDPSSHKGNATCTNAANCTLCGTSYQPDHSYSSTYTQIAGSTPPKHGRFCTTSGCNEYVDEASCTSSGVATCKSGTTCSTCWGVVNGVNPSNHEGSVGANGVYSCCGLGTEPDAVNGVYQISTAGHLVWFSDYVNEGNTNANAILLNDIDMTGVVWTPIASTGLYNEASPETSSEWGYNGTFDGNGNVIRNLTVTGSSTDNASFGLFGTLSGEVHRLGIENFTYTGAGMDSRVGALVGQILGGRVHHCYARNVNINTQIGTQNGVAGGLIGCNYSGTVENCYVASLTVSAGRKGGVVGDNYADGNNSDGTDRPGTVNNCYTDYSSVCARFTEGSVSGGADIDFATGAACNLLNGSQNDGVWKQTLGSSSYPSFTGETVYGGYEFCNSTSMIYSNTPLSETRPEHDYDNGVCTVCYHEVVAKVGDVYYETLDEAIAAATGENALVTLVSNVTLSQQLVITSGTFTLDLNGKTLSSEGFVLYIGGSADVKITDSSEEKDGAIFTSGDRFDTITLYDSAKLEIAGGTVSSHNGKAISMSYAGNASEAELTVSGGTLFTNANNVIFAKGKRITLTGGELHSEESEIYYSNGSIDLSAYRSVLGFELYTDSSFDESVFDVTIPEGYAIDVVTETSALGVKSTRYTVIRNPELYIPVELLRLDDNTNIRYAEINGIQKEIEDVTDDIYYVPIGEENLLIEVVEKTTEGAFVKSQYFYIDMTEKTANELNLNSYMTSDGKKSIRLDTPMGIRFKAGITDAAKQEDAFFVIDEYGYIIALEEHLDGTELTFDFAKHVSGAAYNKAESKDLIFAHENGITTFTGVLYGIPVAKYKTNIVSKTYTKITVNGEQFILYGEAVTGNVYDTAQTLLGKEDVDEETKSKLYQILLDYNNEAGLPVEDLFPKE